MDSLNNYGILRFMKTQTPFRPYNPDQLLLLPPIGPNLGGSKPPESIQLPSFFNFQRTVYRIFKVIRSSPTGSWELYDLKSDPKELNNIITISPEAERMKEIVRSRVRRYQR